MSPPTPQALSVRPTAEDRRIERGAAIWYRQHIGGGYGHFQLVPGVFERYGTIRCAVMITDAVGGNHRIYVSPCNVYVRFPGESDDHAHHARTP